MFCWFFSQSTNLHPFKDTGYLLPVTKKPVALSQDTRINSTDSHALCLMYTFIIPSHISLCNASGFSFQTARLKFCIHFSSHQKYNFFRQKSNKTVSINSNLSLKDSTETSRRRTCVEAKRKQLCLCVLEETTHDRMW